MSATDLPNLSVTQDFSGAEFTPIYTTTVALTGGGSGQAGPAAKPCPTTET